ncbi:MAG: hypothetical protein K8S56_05715 [Candidatus Cloacimonetes bacterium]|nr:hypothetical protein [Candidatus Cloacimonadota bacterium]
MKNHQPSEYDIQWQIADFIRYQYPSVIFHMDLSGVRIPIGLAVKIKRLQPYRAFPDIQICEPRGRFSGLFIELKKTRSDLYTKTGAYRQTSHISEQRTVLANLKRKGYQAVFACGFDEAKQIISDYLDRRI